MKTLMIGLLMSGVAVGAFHLLVVSPPPRKPDATSPATGGTRPPEPKAAPKPAVEKVERTKPDVNPAAKPETNPKTPAAEQPSTAAEFEARIADIFKKELQTEWKPLFVQMAARLSALEKERDNLKDQLAELEVSLRSECERRIAELQQEIRELRRLLEEQQKTGQVRRAEYRDGKDENANAKRNDELVKTPSLIVPVVRPAVVSVQPNNRIIPIAKTPCGYTVPNLVIGPEGHTLVCPNCGSWRRYP